VDGEANPDRLIGRGALGGKEEASSPLGYGSDTLKLMVRDPTSAHAYWDLNADRINAAVGPLGARRAFLRLIGVPSGYLLAEYSVDAQRGSQAVELPEAGSSYVLELAVMHNYQWVVLARSNIIHAPRTTAGLPSVPAFVTRAQRLRLLSESRDREIARTGEDLVAAPTQGAQGARPVAPATGAPVSMGATTGMGPVAAPLRTGSELDPAWEPRFAQSGSEARLTRREPGDIPLLVAGSPAVTMPVAAALGALATAVWLGRAPIDVLRAARKLVSTLADAGISGGSVVAVLDPPEPDGALREPSASQVSSSESDAYAVSESAAGSITVIDRDGYFITYSPMRSTQVADSPRRSAAAVVGVRHGL
jgi:Domain of unknown function (DUF4912)